MYPVKTKDNKTIGFLENGCFLKPVVGSKHQLREPPAWAIDADAFDEWVKPNAREIIVTDTEAKVRYRVSVATFDELKHEMNRGFGRQYFLVLAHWAKEKYNGN